MNLSDSWNINTNALNFNLKINVTTQKFRAKPREKPHQRKTLERNYFYKRRARLKLLLQLKNFTNFHLNKFRNANATHLCSANLSWDPCQQKINAKTPTRARKTAVWFFWEFMPQNWLTVYNLSENNSSKFYLGKCAKN